MRKTGQVITFIDTAVNAAKAVDGRRTEYRLRDTKGYPMDRLVLEVQSATGNAKKPKRIWRVHYDQQQDSGRVRRKVKIGDGQTSLATVRKRWIEIRDVVEEGRDWIAEQRLEEERDAAAKRREMTFAELAELYMSKYARSDKNSYRDDERKLKTPILPAIGHLPAKSIKKAQIIAIIDSVAFREDGRGAPVQADRIKALISSIFNWGRDEDLVEHNPADRIRPRSQNKRRERVYSHNEIRLIWQRLEEGAQTGSWAQFRAVVQLGFLIGQRLREYTSAERDELELIGDRPIWRISSRRVKNKRAHNIPLPPKSVEIFARALEAADQPSPFVFPSASKIGVPLHSDTAGHMFGALTAELGLDGEAIFHAIRHTVRTELGDLGVAKEISERILNHRNPAADISTRYDHGEYYREKYDALHAWERRLMGIVAGRDI
jgi:integrase